MSMKADEFRLETIAKWEAYRMTGKSVPHDVVIKWLDSWGTENELETPLHFSA